MREFGDLCSTNWLRTGPRVMCNGVERHIGLGRISVEKKPVFTRVRET